MKQVLFFGLLYVLAIVGWALAETVVGLHDEYIRYHEYLSYFFAIPIVAIMYYAMQARKRQLNQELTFKRAFVYGLSITAFVLLCSPVLWYVFCTYINTDLLDNLARYHMERKGLSEAVAQRRYALPNYIWMAMASTTTIGVVVSLVLSLITSKKETVNVVVR